MTTFGQIITWKQEKIWPKTEMATRGKYGKITGKTSQIDLMATIS